MGRIDGYFPGWPPYSMYFCDHCKREISCGRYDPPIKVGDEYYCSPCLKKLVDSGEIQITYKKEEGP